MSGTQTGDTARNLLTAEDRRRLRAIAARRLMDEREKARSWRVTTGS